MSTLELFLTYALSEVLVEQENIWNPVTPQVPDVGIGSAAFDSYDDVTFSGF